jgi:hypothetical protein
MRRVVLLVSSVQRLDPAVRRRMPLDLLLIAARAGHPAAVLVVAARELQIVQDYCAKPTHTSPLTSNFRLG